jgi:hypothetical protein
MGVPTVTSDQITVWLKDQDLELEVFDEFPTDMTKARHGVYVNDPATIDRSPYQLGITTGGWIYTATDGFRIILVTFQGDNRRNKAVEAIQNIVNSEDLLEGYHERDYVMSQDYLNRAEYRTYDFSVKRMEFQ